jgi:hypothetical protein
MFSPAELEHHDSDPRDPTVTPDIATPEPPGCRMAAADSDASARDNLCRGTLAIPERRRASAAAINLDKALKSAAGEARTCSKAQGCCRRITYDHYRVIPASVGPGVRWIVAADQWLPQAPKFCLAKACCTRSAASVTVAQSAARHMKASARRLLGATRRW